MHENPSNVRYLEEDEEYDVYLFWPSRRRQESAFATNESSIYGPVAPSFGYDDYFDGLSSLPSSPLSFTEPSDFRFPNVADNRQPETQPEIQPTPLPTTRYSKLVTMGLFSQVSHRVDRVWDRVCVIFQKARL